MKQLERLQLLYVFLQQHQVNLNDLLEYLDEKKATISRRQLERDLQDVERYFLQKNQLLHKITSKRTHYFKIVQQTGNPFLFHTIDTTTVSTHFYEGNRGEHFDQIFLQLQDAIATHHYILIEHLKDDLTGDNYSQTTKMIELAPVRLLHHRGTYYIAGFSSLDKKGLVIFEVDQLVSVVPRSKAYNFRVMSKKADAELKNRFGVTKNIDNQVYDIQLEFTNLLGAFIKRFHWHSSQKFHQKSANDNLIMTMRCGINRELLGWLFQWMYNVKIISPPLLQEYYNKTLSKMQSTQLKNQPFVYRNIFEPK